MRYLNRNSLTSMRHVMHIPSVIKAPVYAAVVSLLLVSAQAHANPSCGGFGRYAVQTFQKRSTVTLGGTVVPFREVTFRAEVPGRVNHIAGDEGSAFAKGDILVALDEEELRAQHAAAMADLRNAEAEMRNAQVMYSRELWNPQSAPVNKAPGGMGVPSMFDQFMTTYMQGMTKQNHPWVDRYADIYSFGTRIEQARNAYSRAQSQLRQIEAKLRDARSIAPFDGMIMRKHAEEGDTVQPGQPLLEFADMSLLQLEVDIPARLMYQGLRVDDRVDAKLDIGYRPVPARVAQIFPMADRQRHTVKVKFDLHPDAPAAPGMYAEVMIPDPNASMREVLVIPLSAVIQQGDQPMVRVVSADDSKSDDVNDEKGELQLVRLGEHVDQEYISVLSGLRVGDCIHVSSKRASPQSNRGGYY
uniref:RND family efflux transporter, MFP subunit n=1 Tax=Candidatus Kentrum sp. SD TaxID=2126332 RepID=A0A450Y731_9GAMM|nr:MAG: RND family efflux transporter, MFP subunit [Candidatus Kentron sp. SD]VFK43738.1 MAG: RND family efflux transporter, MFP subunit [Candidatus Kentron sp. SD]VFK78739.1 MAG: RND family efflux transporter, MFP subunit [Candidatus Kentron sp. SD]